MEQQFSLKTDTPYKHIGEKQGLQVKKPTFMIIASKRKSDT
jgi:hypothetical protein